MGIQRCYNNDMLKNFSIGADIELKTRMRSNVLGVGMEDVVFKGKVVPNPKWLDNDYVSVRTGNPEYPVSHIHKKFIVGFEFSEERSIVRIFKVTSKSKGHTYNVISENGIVSCDCIGFQFRRVCKHSAKVKEYLAKTNA